MLLDAQAIHALNLSEARPVKPGKTFPRGRQCERFDCITVLCIYNAGPTCFIHTHDEFRPMVAA